MISEKPKISETQIRAVVEDIFKKSDHYNKLVELGQYPLNHATGTPMINGLEKSLERPLYDKYFNFLNKLKGYQYVMD